jgi:hypothetical protein
MDKKGRNHVLVGVPFRHRFARRDYRGLQTLSSPISEALILKKDGIKVYLCLIIRVNLPTLTAYSD